MPVTVPRVVRQAWGEEVVTAFAPWMEEQVYKFVEERGMPRDEYQEVLSRLDLLEKDISLIKEEQARFRQDLGQMRAEFCQDLGELRREMNERFDRVNERFDSINERFDGMESRMGERFDGMYDRMLVRSRWLVGSIALFGTVISILLAIGQFVK